MDLAFDDADSKNGTTGSGTMNDFASNNMLRLTTQTPSPLTGQRRVAAARESGMEADSFSRLLERRMNDAAAAKPAPERPRTSERQPVREEASREPVREEASREPVRAHERSTDVARDTQPAEGNPPAGENPPASEADAGTTTAAPVAETGAPPEAVTDPVAASIAALPLNPAIIARPAAAEDENATALTGEPGGSAPGVEKPLTSAETERVDVADSRSGIAAGAGRTDGKANEVQPGTEPAAAMKTQILLPHSPSNSAPADQPDGQSPLAPTGVASASRADTPQLRIQTPVGQRAWADDVGQRLTWMIGRHESKAELVLTPPSLGKLEVSIQLGGDQAAAHFVAASAAAREALEQAMPRLREVLQQAGIQLGEANVSTSAEQHAQQHGGFADPRNGREPERHGGEGDDEITATGRTSDWRRGAGLVDTFA